MTSSSALTPDPITSPKSGGDRTAPRSGGGGDVLRAVVVVPYREWQACEGSARAQRALLLSKLREALPGWEP